MQIGTLVQSFLADPNNGKLERLRVYFYRDKLLYKDYSGLAASLKDPDVNGDNFYCCMLWTDKFVLCIQDGHYECLPRNP